MADHSDHYFVLADRCRYLEVRILAKQSVGWETQYDERERAALEWAMGHIAAGLHDLEAYDRERAALQGDDVA